MNSALVRGTSSVSNEEIIRQSASAGHFDTVGLRKYIFRSLSFTTQQAINNMQAYELIYSVLQSQVSVKRECRYRELFDLNWPFAF